MSASWVKENATFPNVLLLASVLMGVGGYVVSFRTLESRVLALERAEAEERGAAVGHAVRAALNAQSLTEIKEQLSDIKTDLKELKRRP